MQIMTLPVYSKLANESTIPPEVVQSLPNGWQLSEHQVETYKALICPDIDVVINTAMTGDGKSLAGQLPLLINWSEVPTIALYPTNELIQDQYRSIEEQFPKWGQKSDRVATLYGAKLDELYAGAETLSRPEVLLREIQNGRFVLSNPDILHAILQFHYQQFGRAATHIAGQVAQNFAQFIFDEFHIFDAAQMTAVLTGLLLLYEQSRYPIKTLFLSATPDERLIKPLERVGFGDRLKIINPQQAGWYVHGDDPGTGWRPILRGNSITFVPQTAEEWMATGVQEVLLPWFQHYKQGAKAAIIVNSVATALRLVEHLRAVLPTNLRVEPNTGLNGRSTRKASYDADVLVGTSTVDIGVDFRINLLIFEANSAGTMLQRLGRLGRHDGYERDGSFHSFRQFAAYALVPPFVYERLTTSQEKQPLHLHSGDIIDRQKLAEHINAVYPPAADFQQYARTWGRFQPAKVYYTLLGKSVTAKYTDHNLRESFAPIREHLRQRYFKLVQSTMKDAIDQWQSYRHTGEELLVQEAQSFRGGSPFDCGVLKEGEGEPLTYNLFWLLANARLDLLDQQAFCNAVERMGRSVKPYQRGFQVAFFRWLGLREQRQEVTVLLDKQTSDWEAHRHHTAQVLPGVRFDVNGHEWLNTLNRQLARHAVVGVLVPGYEPQQLRREVYLPGLFALHRYRDAYGLAGCVAFGRQALLLDSKLRHRSLRAATGGAFFS